MWFCFIPFVVKKFYCYKLLFHANIPCFCLDHYYTNGRYYTCTHIHVHVYLLGDKSTVIHVYLIWVLISLHKFFWSCHRQPYIKYICISIYAHFIGYWHCMCKMYIASLNAPLILETLQYWCFLKQNAIFNTVCIADPYFVFVKLNVAYYLAISFFFQLSCQIMIFMWFLSTPKKF